MPLVLKSARSNRPDGHWSEHDYDVVCNADAVGRIVRTSVSSTPWFWTIVAWSPQPVDARGYVETRVRCHGRLPGAVGQRPNASDETSHLVEAYTKPLIRLNSVHPCWQWSIMLCSVVLIERLFNCTRVTTDRREPSDGRCRSIIGTRGRLCAPRCVNPRSRAERLPPCPCE
jgi:hypothetical protein